GALGGWVAGLSYAPARQARAAAVELEEAGYGAAWLHEGGRDAFAGAAILLAATERLVVGTSIVSIWRHEPGQMANAARTLGEAFPGRFVLGIGPDRTPSSRFTRRSSSASLPSAQPSSRTSISRVISARRTTGTTSSASASPSATLPGTGANG